MVDVSPRWRDVLAGDGEPCRGARRRNLAISPCCHQGAVPRCVASRLVQQQRGHLLLAGLPIQNLVLNWDRKHEIDPQFEQGGKKVRC
jgi:hypothetical protein